MLTERLDALLNPESIAVVGGRRAILAMEQSRRLGFRGPMWLVNPTTDRLGGHTAHPSLSALPQQPDAVFVAVEADKTVDVVADAAGLGVNGAVAYASGFAEVGRIDRTEALRSAAGDMPVIGPNCHGFVNALTGAALWPDVCGCEQVERGVAIVSQSGNIAINLTMQQRSVSLSHVITIGNQAIVSAAHCIEALLDDRWVDAIGLYVEGIPDPAAFGAAALRAHDSGVPLVALTAGATDGGGDLVLTHTGALAGSRAKRSALLARYGVTEVATPGELMATLAVLGRGGRLAGPQVVSLSSSGGEAALVADQSAPLPLVFAPFDVETKRNLEDLLDGRVVVANPFDYHTYIWGDRERMTEIFAIAAGGRDAAMLILDWPAAGIDDSDWWPTLEAFCAAVASTGVRGVVTTTLAENLPQHVAVYLAERSIAAIPGVEHALAALAAGQPVAPRLAHLAGLVDVVRTTIDEAAAKDVLRRAGLTVPNGRVCRRTEVAEAAETIGFPVVLKSLATAHRTDVGGVAVGLANRAEVEAAVDAMADLGEDFLVEEQITDAVAELFVGVAYERPIGWSLTIGAGGVLAELIDDVATLLLPADRDDVEAVLRSLRVAALLGGYRGSPVADMTSVLDAVDGIARVAVEQFAEIEANPLLVHADGAWIGDALIQRLKAVP